MVDKRICRLSKVWWKDVWSRLVNSSWPILLEVGIIPSVHHALWEFELPVIKSWAVDYDL